jgi:hypothetical protein
VFYSMKRPATKHAAGLACGVFRCTNPGFPGSCWPYRLERLAVRLRLAVLRLAVLRLEPLRLVAVRVDVLRLDDLRGTRAPERRASDRPMAIACLRLVTFRPERPLFNVPRFRSCIAFSTFLDAPLLYFLAMIGTPFVRSTVAIGAPLSS